MQTPGLRSPASSFASTPTDGPPPARQPTTAQPGPPPSAPTVGQPRTAPTVGPPSAGPPSVGPSTGLRQSSEPRTQQHSVDLSPTEVPADTFEEILDQLFALVSGARPLPLSSSVMMTQQNDVLNLIAGAMERLPEEIQQAKWVLKERDEVLAKAQADAALLIDDARSKAAQLVQKSEVVRSAERRAGQLIDDAKTNARRQQMKVDDYCEAVLRQFEEALTYVFSQVSAARGALAPEPLRPDELARADGTGGSQAGGPHAGVPHADGPADAATQRHEAVTRGDVPKAGRGVVYDQEKLEPSE